MEIVGWIGSIAFGLCALPQAWEAYKNKACYLNKPFLFLWTTGEVFTLAYALHIGTYPLIANYVMNALCLAVILRYNKSIDSKGV